MGCHILSVQHTNKTAKNRFGSENSNNHACFCEKPVRGELQENANPEDRRHLIIEWIFEDDKKNSHLNLSFNCLKISGL
jgi:hypothetical protein